jgi:hypothetical protein
MAPVYKNQALRYRASVRGPHMSVTIAAADAMSGPVTAGFQYEVLIGNNCYVRFIMAWKTAAAKTLLPALL